MEKNSFRYQHASLRSTNIAIEHVPFSSLTHPLKWVIFHSKLLVYQRVAAFPGRVPWDFYPARLALLLFTCNDFGPSQIPAEVQKDPQTPRPTRPGWLPGDVCWVLRTCRLDEDTNGWNIHIWLSDLVKISIEDEVMFFFVYVFKLQHHVRWMYNGMVAQLVSMSQYVWDTTLLEIRFRGIHGLVSNRLFTGYIIS